MILNDGNGERSEAYRLLADLFARPPAAEDLETVRDDLDLESRETEFEIFAEFNRLLACPGGALPPLESRYNAGHETAVVETLTAAYEEAGLTFGEEYQLVPDHLSIEFLFMSYLIDTRDLERQEQFLEEHIMRWVPTYCERVVEWARTAFYREIAAVTRAFLEREYADFE